MKASETAKEAIRKCFMSNVEYCYPFSFPYPHELKYVSQEKHVKV